MKTNVGHTESVAGLVSVIKAVLMLEKKMIPPNALFAKPNSNIPLQDLNSHGAAQEGGEGGDTGLHGSDSHRRTFSERLAGLRPGARDEQYRRLSSEERSLSPPAPRRNSPTPVAILTDPSGRHERIPDDDDETGLSPVEDRGAFQAAIGFAGLSINASSDAHASDDFESYDES